MDKLMSTTHENIIHALSNQADIELRHVINRGFSWNNNIEEIIFSELKP
jgi:hypothetical protein